ncbi:MAG: GxxExxY protein [Prevotella sp.]
MYIQETTIDPVLKDKLKQYVYPILGCCQLVHHEMGPWLNEPLYQDALAIALNKKKISFIKEYRFYTSFLGEHLPHHHQVDFFVQDKVYIECKAVSAINIEHRQQLWNYMRLTKVRIGILYNFAPTKDQCEKYYFNPDDNSMSLF